MPEARIGVADRVTVAGLGHFGVSVARNCHEIGYDVLAIDVNEARVQDATAYTTLAVQGDATDEALLRSLQVERSDVAVVAVGSDVANSVLITMVMRSIGVPLVYAEATDALHGDVLSQIGANRVIFPERDAGYRLAHELAVPSTLHYMTLSATSGISRVAAPVRFHNEPLGDPAAGDPFAILAVLRGESLISCPASDLVILPGDQFILGGPDVAVEQFVEAEAEPGLA